MMVCQSRGRHFAAATIACVSWSEQSICASESSTVQPITGDDSQWQNGNETVAERRLVFLRTTTHLLPSSRIPSVDTFSRQCPDIRNAPETASFVHVLHLAVVQRPVEPTVVDGPKSDREGNAVPGPFHSRCPTPDIDPSVPKPPPVGSSALIVYGIASSFSFRELCLLRPVGFNLYCSASSCTHRR